MAKVRRILKHVVVELAEGQRKCHRSRNKHKIQAGDVCLAIYEGSPKKRKNYCRTCAGPILTQAQADLDAFVCQLDS